MNDLNLNQLEKKILDGSANIQVTKSRMKMVLISAVFFIIALSFAAFVLKSVYLVASICILYVLITLFEKLAYGKVVIAYKTLIQKLHQRIKELETELRVKE